MSGDATLASGGALTIANDAVSADKLQNFGANEVVCRNANSAGSVSGVAVADTQILIGDGDGFAAAALSGDATMTNGGVVTIANDAVDNNKLANIARGSVKVGGASNAPTDLDAKTSGSILVGDGVDVKNVAMSGDATLAAGGAITMAATQNNISSIFNNSLKLGYGSSDAHIDFGTDNKILFDIDDTQAFEINGSGVVVAGNLTVQGTTTTVDSTTINISSSFTFEGPVDDFQTTLHAGTPTQDITVYLPQYSASAGAHSAYLCSNCCFCTCNCC
jgi:hypothetical protein